MSRGNHGKILSEALMEAAGVPQTPIDGVRGVFISEGGAVVGSAMKMTGAVVSSGQTQTIYSRGAAISGRVLQSATQYVSNGGVASACVIGGGYPVRQYVYSGGTTVSCSIGLGALVNASGGALVQDCFITSNASCVINNGARGINLSGGGTMTIVVGEYNFSGHGYLNGGTFSGGRVMVAYNGYAENFTANCSFYVYGYASHTYINGLVNGGSMLLDSSVLSGYSAQQGMSGAATFLGGRFNTTDCVLSQGTATIFGGYWARSVTMLTGCTMTINPGATASAVTVSSGGKLTVNGSASGVVMSQLGTMTVSSGGVASALTMHDGAVTVDANGVLDGAVVSHGTLQQFAGANSGAIRNVTLLGGAIYARIRLPGGTFDAVVSGGTMHVQNSGYVSGATVAAGGALVVSSGCTALAVTSETGAAVTVLDGGYIEYA